MYNMSLFGSTRVRDNFNRSNGDFSQLSNFGWSGASWGQNISGRVIYNNEVFSNSLNTTGGVYFYKSFGSATANAGLKFNIGQQSMNGNQYQAALQVSGGAPPDGASSASNGYRIDGSVGSTAMNFAKLVSGTPTVLSSITFPTPVTIGDEIAFIKYGTRLSVNLNGVEAGFIIDSTYSTVSIISGYVISINGAGNASWDNFESLIRGNVIVTGLPNNYYVQISDGVNNDIVKEISGIATIIPTNVTGVHNWTLTVYDNNPTTTGVQVTNPIKVNGGDSWLYPVGFSTNLTNGSNLDLVCLNGYTPIFLSVNRDQVPSAIALRMINGQSPVYAQVGRGTDNAFSAMPSTGWVWYYMNPNYFNRKMDDTFVVVKGMEYNSFPWWRSYISMQQNSIVTPQQEVNPATIRRVI